RRRNSRRCVPRPQPSCTGRSRSAPEPEQHPMATMDPDGFRDEVRETYAAAARAVMAESTGCCGRSSGCATTACCDGGTTPAFGAELYPRDDRAALPADAVTASLGCGTPLAVADLAEGETVL